MELGVNWCISCHVTQQNVNFTKIAFAQSVLKIETSRWNKKNNKIHVHILATILAQIDAVPVM